MLKFKNLKPALILNVVFLFFATFISIFTLLRFFLKSAGLALLFTLFACILICFIYILRFNKKSAINKITKTQKYLQEDLLLTLALFDKNKQLSFINSVFSNLNYQTQKAAKTLTLLSNNKSILPIFAVGEVDVNALCKNLQNIDTANLTVLTATLTGQAKQTLNRLNVGFLPFDEFFAFVLQSGVDLKFVKTTARAAKKIAINIDLSRKKAKTFLFFGFMLLLFSLIAIYPLYYIISGTIFVIVSLFLKFFSPKNKSYTKFLDN